MMPAMKVQTTIAPIGVEIRPLILNVDSMICKTGAIKSIINDNIISGLQLMLFFIKGNLYRITQIHHQLKSAICHIVTLAGL